MAIARMTKVMIVTYRPQAADLLEQLQSAGICQILNAEEAMVTKDLPEVAPPVEKPKDLEALLGRLDKAIAFLKNYAPAAKGLAAALAPRTVVDEQTYRSIVGDDQTLQLLEQCEQLQTAIDKAQSQLDNEQATLQMLQPWQSLQCPVEQLTDLRQTVSWTGLVPSTQFEHLTERIVELGVAIQLVGSTGNKYACLIVALKENVEELQKILRAVEFEPVNFEHMTGTVPQLIQSHTAAVQQLQQQLADYYQEAHNLARDLLKLEILYDHYSNLLNRENTRHNVPATRYTVLLEAWVKQKDYPQLQQIVSQFPASTVAPIEPAEDEEVPVDIENKPAIRPFEVITRLYGMPKYFEVDPTVFLAPFFALFFGLCLTDAGYGLVIVAFVLLFIKKIQGDRKLMWMLAICGGTTVVAGAMTGGWFGDAIQSFIPVLAPIRQKLMWFDPLEKPMLFFGLSLALGYVQIMTGLVIAFGHNLKRRDYVAAVFDQLTWLVMLNSILLFGASKAGLLPAHLGKYFGYLALLPAAGILLFSERQGSLVGKIGMGMYNLFSAIFYVGDVLSYLRLMALGMVTAGLAMAINVIADIAGRVPGIGIILFILVFVGGHAFNMAINALGAFVHTLRLQYVEFFPKFLVGGGRAFEPLTKKYRHIYIKKEV